MTPEIKTGPPVECILWKAQRLEIERLRASFDVLKTFLEDSHMVRRLLRCKECGHLYFYEFYEEIDWQEGKDGQYWTWIPVDDEGSGECLSRLTVMEVLRYPYITFDYPKGNDDPRGPMWMGRGSG